MDQLKRVIVDYKKLTPEVLKLLVDRYPGGYDKEHIISFRNASGERIEAVEVVSIDTKYLVKISAKLVVSMANFGEVDMEEYKSAEKDSLEDLKQESALEEE